MKLKMITAALMLATTTVTTVQAEALKTDQQKLSYSLGAMLGERLKNDFESLDSTALSQGMNDALAGSELVLDQQDMIAAIEKAQQEQVSKLQKQAEESAQINKEKGDQFLKQNSQKEGVNTTESGLQYKVLTKGSGATAIDGAEVTVHYEGKTLDGVKFDSSYDRGEPAKFRTNQVIRGWTEALKIMPEGSTWEVYVPSDLAYGPGGAGGAIGPNETLVFKIELIKVNQPDAAQPDAAQPDAAQPSAN